MKITLYMATSIDGYIAKQDGNSDWVSEVDAPNFEKQIHARGCIILGNNTFQQYQGELYPIKDITNIVITNNKSNKSTANVIYVETPQEAIQAAETNGHNQALLIGGGITNGLFLKENLINEIILTVHPLAFGKGIKLFEGIKQTISLELIEQKPLSENLLQVTYKILS